MSENLHQITLSAELESLSLFRELIKTTGKNSGLNESDVYDVQLAVDEICTNIIKHGYEGMDPGSIILRAGLEGDEFRVVVTDFGHPFEPTEPPAPNIEAPLEARDEGGLGLFFVFMSVDDLQYESSPTGNVTTLIKKRK